MTEEERAEQLSIARDAELDGRTEDAKKIRDQLPDLGGVEALLGKTLVSVVQTGSERITFVSSEGKKWQMVYHEDCCASCSIEDVVGDLEDLVGAPIAMAEESTNRDDPSPEDRYPESYTWTFYRFATVKGYVTIRWYGSSNGYYSETASFEKVYSE